MLLTVYGLNPPFISQHRIIAEKSTKNKITSEIDLHSKISIVKKRPYYNEKNKLPQVILHEEPHHFVVNFAYFNDGSL